jgi:hypothetical protein
MRRVLLVVLALALLAALVPAKASARHTLAHRVSTLEGKMACLVRYPVTEFGDLAWYGVQGENDPVYDETDSGNPDSLTDLGPITALDWDYFFQQDPAFPPDAWLAGVKNTRACRQAFALGANPSAAAAAQTQARALAHRMQ